MAYLHKFETVSAFTEARTENYREPWVSAIVENRRVDYNKTKEEKLLETPLTFEILSDGQIVWAKNSNNVTSRTIEYRKNGGEWTQITSANEYTDTPPTISVASGDVIEFKGNNDYYGRANSTVGSNHLSSNAKCKVKGNIMSLINSTNFASLTEFPEESTSNFCGFFRESAGLEDASQLVLPAKTATRGCYADMFFSCTTLTQGPELPATTLVGRDCYEQMFKCCTSLITPPELPSTSLALSCYYGMFVGCTSLTTAPELPATTLTENCYYEMFSGCTSLINAPELPSTSLALNCYYGMFKGCTSLTTAPELPATTLAESCYFGMFSGCTNLNYIKCLATDISATSCTVNWVSGVASTGTFVKNSEMTGWSTGQSGIPSGWSVQNAS